MNRDARAMRMADPLPWHHPDAAIPVPPTRRDVRCDLLDDQAILFDTVTASTYRLNPTALFVWQACEQGVMLNDLIDDFAAHYGVEQDVAREDVEQLVTFFAAERLFDVEHEDGGGEAVDEQAGLRRAG